MSAPPQNALSQAMREAGEHFGKMSAANQLEVEALDLNLKADAYRARANTLRVEAMAMEIMSRGDPEAMRAIEVARKHFGGRA